MEKIMELPWTDEGDGNIPFTAESIGGAGEDDIEEIVDRLNAAADYLVKTYNLNITEARNRLWNQGDFYPRLLMVEAETPH